MGEEILARYGVLKPDTTPAVFKELSKNHIIPKDLANDLANLYRFRNDIAHQEMSLDSSNLNEALLKYYNPVHDFYEMTLKWERNHTGKKMISQIYDGTGIMSTIRSIFK